MSGDLNPMELMELLKPLFGRGEFDKIYNILVDHEREIEVKLKNGEKGKNVIKEECWSLEKKQNLVELEKSTFDMLQRSQRECEDLMEKVTRLTEEVRMSSDKLKRAEDRYAKVCKEENEKDETIIELNEKLKDMENEIQMKDQFIGWFREKLKCGDLKIAQLRNEHQELQSQKSAADETIEKIRNEKFEVDRTVEELKRQYSEASEMLRRQNLEASNTIEELKRLILAAEKKTRVSCENMKDVVPNDNAAESLHQAGEPSGYSSPQAENNGVRQGKGSDRLQGSDFIIILDSDNETSSSCESLGEKEKINERSPFSSLTFHQNSSQPKRKRGSLDSMQIGRQREKHVRKSTHERDESLDDDFSGKLNQEFDGTTQTNIPSMNNQDSEESCPESQQCKTWMYGVEMLEDFKNNVELCMNVVCVLYRRQHRLLNTTSESVVDSSEGQQNTSSESAADSSGGLSHFNAMGGRALAEYLINGDPEQRLRKSVNEVKDQYPEALERCRQLAKDYYAMLFYIYCTGEDPFFKSG